MVQTLTSSHQALVLLLLSVPLPYVGITATMEFHIELFAVPKESAIQSAFLNGYSLCVEYAFLQLQFNWKYHINFSYH